MEFDIQSIRQPLVYTFSLHRSHFSPSALAILSSLTSGVLPTIASMLGSMPSSVVFSLYNTYGHKLRKYTTCIITYTLKGLYIRTFIVFKGITASEIIEIMLFLLKCCNHLHTGNKKTATRAAYFNEDHSSKLSEPCFLPSFCLKTSCKALTM